MSNEIPFDEIIYAYTRKQALADGEQIEVTTTAREAGITFRCFLTRAVFDVYVAVPPGVTGQDESGRLWDVLWMTRFAIASAIDQRAQSVRVQIYVSNSDTAKPKLVTLVATVGPVNIDDPAPAITIMVPGED